MDIIPESIENYASRYSSPEPETLKMLNRDTHAKVLRPRMLSGHLQGRVLSFISRMAKPERIIEIGTYTGYSAICLAEGLQDGGLLHTIDHNPELEDFARHYINKAGYGDKVIQHTGEALDILPDIDEVFDLAFIDADKDNYIRYFDLVYKSTRPGGIIIADNVLWSGKVIGKPDTSDKDALAIAEFNEYIRSHTGITNILLPFRDGLMIIEKTSV